MAEAPRCIRASAEHEKNFRATWKLKKEFEDNPECQAAFEYAATYKLAWHEMAYIAGIIERINNH